MSLSLSLHPPSYVFGFSRIPSSPSLRLVLNKASPCVQLEFRIHVETAERNSGYPCQPDRKGYQQSHSVSAP